MFCPSCGSENTESAQFCEICGKPVVPDTGVPVTAPPPVGQGEWGTYAGVGIVVAVVGIFFIPVVLCPIAIILGYIATKRGERNGKLAMIAGGVCLVVGILLSLMFIPMEF